MIADESPTRSMSGVTDSLVGAWVKGKDTSPVFENYEIIQELPQGGQAIVYKAIHKPTKTHVAMKILLPTLVASTRARYYFEREAELIADCRLAIADFGKTRDQKKRCFYAENGTCPSFGR